MISGKYEQHREGGESAFKEFDPQTGMLIIEQWWDRGMLHRQDAPAYVKFDRETGLLIREDWYYSGSLHRLDSPALRVFSSETGAVTLEEWHVEGVLIKRKEYDPKTLIMISEEYFKDGELHRDNDDPAMIIYDALNGNCIIKKWYKDGKMHKENAPAFIRYHRETGKILSQVDYKNGIWQKKEGENLLTRPKDFVPDVFKLSA